MGPGWRKTKEAKGSDSDSPRHDVSIELKLTSLIGIYHGKFVAETLNHFLDCTFLLCLSIPYQSLPISNSHQNSYCYMAQLLVQEQCEGIQEVITLPISIMGNPKASMLQPMKMAVSYLSVTGQFSIMIQWGHIIDLLKQLTYRNWGSTCWLIWLCSNLSDKDMVYRHQQQRFGQHKACVKVWWTWLQFWRHVELGLEYLVIFCTIPLQVSGRMSSIGTCPNIKQMLPKCKKCITSENVLYFQYAANKLQNTNKTLLEDLRYITLSFEFIRCRKICTEDWHLVRWYF